MITRHTQLLTIALEMEVQKLAGKSTDFGINDMLATYAINRSLQCGFAAEWAESLRVKDSHPEDEDEIARVLKQRHDA
jgi:hypothetical protein